MGSDIPLNYDRCSKKMKVIVAYSGGKDSQASLIWAIKKYGVSKIKAVFCDTGWENPITYQHISETTKDLGVELITVKSKKYNGMVDMAKKKGRFASTMARFCTSELKAIPFIDYVLDQKEHLIIIQGIRSDESESRSLMKKQCRYFKYYFEPYNINKKTGKLKLNKKTGDSQKPKYHTYRKKDIVEFRSKYSDDIFRPVFNWTGKQVIDYILENGQKPNPLYYEGFKRVGCFPCFMCGHQEVRQIIARYPERFNELIQIEKEVGNSFFKIDYIPDRFKTGLDEKSGKKYTRAIDIRKYLNNKNATLDMFESEGLSCMSFYSLCE